MLNLKKLRLKIDTIDDTLLKLLSEKMNYIKRIEELKQSSGITVYRPERERAIINRLKSQDLGLLGQNAIEAIYRELFAVSRNLELPQAVAYFGPEGTYTHQAARVRLGTVGRYILLTTIEDVLEELANKEAEFGVAPIENNTEGAVGVTLDCLGAYEGLKVFDETYMGIHHSFVGINENIKEIERIYSHPQGHDRCRKFLENHGLNAVEFVPAKSTANTTCLVSQDKKPVAICSKIAAKIYNVPLLFDKIENNAANRTRFLILSDMMTPKIEHCKTSVLAYTAHKPGGLSALLEGFKKESINLTKLEPRPVEAKEFLHSFYTDFEGHIEDKDVKRALKSNEDIVWLGSCLEECQNTFGKFRLF